MPKFKFVLTVIFVFTLFFVITLLFSAYSGQTAAAGDIDGATMKVIKGHSRRFLTDVLDYDYGGANSKHDPRKKPGIGH